MRWRPRQRHHDADCEQHRWRRQVANCGLDLGVFLPVPPPPRYGLPAANATPALQRQGLLRDVAPAAAGALSTSSIPSIRLLFWSMEDLYTSQTSSSISGLSSQKTSRMMRTAMLASVLPLVHSAPFAPASFKNAGSLQKSKEWHTKLLF